MAQIQFKLRVAFAWWLKPYLCGVILTAWLMRAEPDQAKIAYWVGKAVKCKVSRE